MGSRVVFRMVADIDFFLNEHVSTKEEALRSLLGKGGSYIFVLAADMESATPIGIIEPKEGTLNYFDGKSDFGFLDNWVKEHRRWR